jgi:hypothetical protein
MESSSVSIFYNGIANTESNKTIPFDIFLENIRDGKWQDEANRIRLIKDKKERDSAKKNMPYVTLSGKFSNRADSSLEAHSGYIGMDFDDVDVNKLKDNLSKDPYCVSAFMSISGRGVCAVFRVNAKKHREAFQGLSEYLYRSYGEPCDPTSINVSRARFVSWDPDIYINYGDVEKFAQYPKDKAPKKVDKAIYAPDDFKFVLDQIIDKRINLCDNYYDWLRIGFALVHQFKEDGREYFHIVSQFSSKYDPRVCDKQYDNCLKHQGGSIATIAMFYYYARQAGLEIYSERTRKIAYSAIQGKKSGLSAEVVSKNLERFEGITGAADVVKQVMDNNIELNEDTLIDQLEIYLRQNYDLRRNSITRYIENEGRIIHQKDLNTIYVKAKKVFESLTYDLLDRIINSDYIPTYNPFLDFINRHLEDERSTGHIDKLFSSIKNRDPAYVAYFGKKWFVSIISAIHGIHSPLMFVLTGDQRAGKTEFFRRMLPEELRSYYAESKLDAGKDDEILMTQKIVIVDDEFGGKSKKEAKKLKDLTSKQTFSLREPYGRNNVDLVRLAVLGGTTNDTEILSDSTGNRRIIPVIVEWIDRDIYNSVDKTALFMEAYWLWKEGFNWTVLSDEDVSFLRQDEGMFEMANIESELIQRYYELPDSSYAEEMTATDVKVELENLTRQKLILDRIGKELTRLGYQQRHVKLGKGTKRYYLVVKTERLKSTLTKDGIPF